MGFLGTIPANKLAAAYDVSQKKLILSAEGVVIGATYGFHFDRDNFMGGLKYTLMAWTGPLTGKDQPYEFEEGFIIDLPDLHFNSGSVIIVISNHPEGVVVPIHYLGLAHEQAGLTTTDALQSKGDVAASITADNTNQLNVLFKMP